MKTKFIIFLIGIAFIGCDMAIKDNIVGNYYITAADVGEQAALSYKDSEGENYYHVIQSCVYSVGFNDKFIVAKQHPYEFVKGIDKSVTLYYILPILSERDWNIDDGLIGPLDKNQFKVKSDSLGIQNIGFTIVYDYMK